LKSSVLLFVSFSPGIVVMHNYLATVGAARYCIVLNCAGKQSTHLQVCRLNQTPCLLSDLSWTSSWCAFLLLFF
jgi:hypothetical protein